MEDFKDYQKISDCIRDLQAILEEHGDLPICLVTSDGTEKFSFTFDHQFDMIEMDDQDGIDVGKNWVKVCGFNDPDDFEDDDGDDGEEAEPPFKMVN